jgi:dolichyl-phosphate-mannose--protein O-mannosyl transferase
MNNPLILAGFIVVFILLGVYNVFTGLRRQREARLRGQHLIWYKQINLLTGIEFLLFSFIFMASLNLRNSAFPSGLKNFLSAVYLIALFGSAILAGFVIRQAFMNMRSRSVSSPQTSRNSTNTLASESNTEMLTPEQRSVNIQRRRERRQKAAAQRRRRAGKA